MSRNHHRTLPTEVQEGVQERPPAVQHRIERVWNALGRVEDAPADVPTIDAAWADLQTRLARPSSTTPPRRAADRAPVRTRSRRRWAVGLAMLAVVLLAGLWGWTRPVTVTVAPGARQTVDLPDGSRVDLNSGSHLTYRRGFAVLPGWPADQRRVTLHGEAFFDVVQDGRPFAVVTFNARIDVLGTRFNVRAWPEQTQHETRVTLEEGRVRLASPTGTQAVTLSEPGQTARITADVDSAIRLPAADLDDVLAWRQGGFVMNREPTAAVLAELQRRFGVSIEVEDALVLADSTSLTYWRDAEIETVIHDFCLAQGCQYRRISRGFVLVPAEPGSSPLNRR